MVAGDFTGDGILDYLANDRHGDLSGTRGRGLPATPIGLGLPGPGQ